MMFLMKQGAMVLTIIALAMGLAQAQETRFDFRTLEKSKIAPDLDFSDIDGNRMSLRDFRGKLVLLNVWATWCPPCRKELPALAGLQSALGGAEFQVVALATDTGRLNAVKRLYGELGLDESGIFLDESGAAMRDLRVFALPTTLLIDGDGNEIGRKIGPAVWDNPAALAFFRSKISGTDGKTMPQSE